jgi:WD40 repeat protein
LRSLAFAPDGRRIATTAGTSKFVWLWDALTGELTAKLGGHAYYARAVAFSPDGRYVASSDNGWSVRVWSVGGGEPLATLTAPDRWYTGEGLSFTPDGSCLYSPFGSRVRFWSDPARPAAAPRPPDGVLGGTPLSRIVPTPGGRWLLGVNGPVAALIDRLTGASVRRFADPLDQASPEAYALAADGSRVAVAFGHRAAVWDLADRQAPPAQLVGHARQVRAVGFTPDGRTVLTAGCDGTARTWDAATGAARRVYDWGVGNVYVAAFAPDGLTAAAGTGDGHLVVWDVE